MNVLWFLAGLLIGGTGGALIAGVLAAGRDPERVYMGDPADMYDEGNSGADPFKLLDLIDAQARRADSYELSTWRAIAVLMDVLDDLTIEEAHETARSFLRDQRICGQPADALDQRYRDYFVGVIKKRTAFDPSGSVPPVARHAQHSPAPTEPGTTSLSP